EVKMISVPFGFTRLRPSPVGKNGGGGGGATPAPYKTHVPSIDEGWTRWGLDKQSSLQYATIEDAEIRERGLRAKSETILVPDQLPRLIFGGYRAGAMPPEYSGGLGEKGVKSLKDFVEEGGNLVFLNRASDFAIEQFKLPLRDVTAGLPRT